MPHACRANPERERHASGLRSLLVERVVILSCMTCGGGNAHGRNDDEMATMGGAGLNFALDAVSAFGVADEYHGIRTSSASRGQRFRSFDDFEFQPERQDLISDNILYSPRRPAR